MVMVLATGKVDAGSGLDPGELAPQAGSMVRPGENKHIETDDPIQMFDHHRVKLDYIVPLEVVRQYGITRGRVSQLRRELHDGWLRFHGELPESAGD